MGSKKDKKRKALGEDPEAEGAQVSTKKSKKRKSSRESSESSKNGKKKSKESSKRKKKRDSLNPSIQVSITPSVDHSGDTAIEPNIEPGIEPSTGPCVDSHVQPSDEPIDDRSVESGDESIDEPNIEQRSVDKIFPRASSIKLPTRAELKQLPSDAQASLFTALGSSCEQILRLIDDVEIATTLWREERTDGRGAEETALALEDTLVADMARLKSVPIARQFTEMTLWKRIKKFNEKQLTHIKSLRSDIGNDDTNPGETAVGKREHAGAPKKTQEFLSFKAAHLAHLTTAYVTDLEKLREAESLDVTGVKALLRCLDEGAELFATVMTHKKQ